MKQNNFLKIFLLLGDIFCMYLALFLALLVRGSSLLSQFKSFSYNFVILYVIWIFIIFILALYDLHFFKKFIDFIFNLIIFSVLAFFIGVTYFYFRPTFGITPKTVLLLNVLIFDVLFLFWRYLFSLILEANIVKEKVVIVGFQDRLREMLPQIKRRYEVVAIFCPSYVDGQKQCLVSTPELKVISEMPDFKDVVEKKKVTSIIFALDFYSNKDLVQKIFSSLPLVLSYIDIDDLYESINKKVSLDYLDELWFLEKISKPEDIFNQSVKRLFDIVLSIIGLAVFIIFLPFIALAIKIEDRGSVFYTQKRAGKNGRIFKISKFRTMKEKRSVEDGIWREKNNDSITKFGKVLRKLHLDELPQAWSILKGELSFVGPRPEWIEIANIFEKKIPFYKQRYLVKPGLFGWAQINYPASKSVNEAKEKFEYDLYYIKNRSLLLDLEIIFKALKLFFW